MKFGVILFNQAEELDFAGPWELVRLWKAVAGGPDALVVAESTAPVTCAQGLSVNPHIDFASCPSLDYLLVPGGWGTRREVGNRALVDFVARQAQGCRTALSVCTGAFVLHAAALLSGRRATTHWASLERLRALGDVTVVEDRFVRDGNVWTSAGVSAGMDMLLAFIASEAGEDAAGKVQLAAEYYPSEARYGGPDLHVQAPLYARKRP